ncbi:nucleotide disphospho-sugar-binding domain-containing protein [Amycolatopsis suaedae]|uniref:Glycosyltransferase n=1 Tax=Amycolatopsis suaedae TaxID=2510978 RepID=A0A4Q7J3W9_9PSEU|nr:nucleotide disphospho-sugar-binding domain-containing protein [Amycolatopsis suaedae]RZQ61322.1 glycosyltransferase [Amycolatopsis suaedae]
MRVLFSFLPHWSHFAPMVPLASVLQARGHDVLVSAPADLAPRITGAGLSHVPVLDELDVASLAGFGPRGEKLPEPSTMSGKLTREGRGFGRASRLLLEPTGRLLDTWRPDLVVTDVVEFGARIAAARRDIPVVLHEWGMPIPAEIPPASREELADELAAADVDHPALTIQARPAELYGATPDVQRMRFIPFNGTGSLPLWTLRPSGRPRVCLTSGNTAGNSPRAAGRLAETARRLIGDGFEVLLAVGHRVRPDLPELPDDVRLIGWLPLGKILPTCDALVHHGGSGSTMTALALGVPQVAMSLFTDEFGYAGDVARLGVGVALTTGTTDPGDVADTCAKLVAEPAYRQRAAQVRAGIEAQPSPVEVAGIVERLL